MRYLYVSDSSADTGAGGIRGTSRPTVAVKESGPLVASLVFTADAPGCRRYQVEYRLTADADRLDIRVTLDKIAVRQKESVHVAFPFNVPSPVTRYDVPWGIVVPERDQIYGACKNFFSACSWVDVSNDTAGITLALPDIALFELDSITAETPWRTTTASSATVVSYVMNNYWHTNYKADQEGPVTLRYAIRPHGAFDAGEAFRFGREQREPLQIGEQEPQPSLLTISSPEILAGQVTRDAASCCWSTILFNTSYSQQRATLHARSGDATRMTLSHIDGGEEQPCDGTVTLPPHALRLLRVCRATD
jgi:alpha-mannosidase